MDLKTATELVPTARFEGDALIIAVRGEIDLHNSPEVRTEVLDLIAKHAPHRLIFNLAEVPYMDSSALRGAGRGLAAIAGSGGQGLPHCPATPRQRFAGDCPPCFHLYHRG